MEINANTALQSTANSRPRLSARVVRPRSERRKVWVQPSRCLLPEAQLPCRTTALRHGGGGTMEDRNRSTWDSSGLARARLKSEDHRGLRGAAFQAAMPAFERACLSLRVQ